MDWMQLITSVGFPIVAAVFLSIYIIKKDKAQQQQLETITKTLTEAHEKEAAKLAAFYSKGKEQENVEIDYIEICENLDGVLSALAKLK